MYIYIDPRCRFNYTNYYILGLKLLYQTAKIVFDVSYFPQHMLSAHLENNSSIPIIINGKKIFIDADDKKKIDEENGMKNETVQLAQTQQNKQQSRKVVVRASKKSGVYYTPTHPSYNNIAARNLLVFSSEEAAQRAGYRRAA